MPATAKKHFDEDIARARQILRSAHGITSTTSAQKLLKEDLLRSALMFSVGAADGYFCGAYADLIAKILRAKTLQSNISMPEAIRNLNLPVSAFFYPTGKRNNWKWRMAARGIVEKDNVLSLSKVQKLLNPFFRKGYKLFEPPVIDNLIISHNAPNRVTGLTRAQYRSKTGQALDSARKSIRKKMNARFKKVFQRRNDCIHNCDRPKISLQPISYTKTDKVLKDMNLIINVIDQHIEYEFNQLLLHIGCNALTKNAAGY